MKKIKFCFLLLTLTGLCSFSCQQDGIYTPKQKIKQLSMEKVRYYAGYQVGEIESYKEFWTWENNLLKSIKHETDNDLETAIMTYDGKMIKSITIGNRKINFFYKNGKIEKIESTGGNAYKKIIVQVRGKGNMIELRYEISGDGLTGKNGFEQTTSDLFAINHFIMPGFPSDMMQKSLIEQKNAIIGSKADIFVVLVTLQYNNNDKNVGKQTIENRSTGTKETYNYRYDTKKNPFFHSFMELLEVTGVPVFCSQNNIISSYKESEASVITTYTYDYNKDEWPISCDRKTLYDPNFPSSYTLETWKYIY